MQGYCSGVVLLDADVVPALPTTEAVNPAIQRSETNASI